MPLAYSLSYGEPCTNACLGLYVFNQIAFPPIPGWGSVP